MNTFLGEKLIWIDNIILSCLIRAKRLKNLNFSQIIFELWLQKQILKIIMNLGNIEDLKLGIEKHIIQYKLFERIRNTKF